MNKSILEKSINSRRIEKELSINMKKLHYAIKYYYHHTNKKVERLLVIGIGHGHDAILSLLEGYVELIDGVDPFYAADGNDDRDYNELLEIINKLELTNNINVHKLTIQDYLKNKKNMIGLYDMVIIPDTLHHIYVTKSKISNSKYKNDCVQLFKSIYEVVKPGGHLCISEAPRNGVIPMLTKCQLIKTEVDYSTKQQMAEWKNILKETSWSYKGYSIYIPNAFKILYILNKFRCLSYVFSSRYFLYYKK